MNLFKMVVCGFLCVEMSGDVIYKSKKKNVNRFLYIIFLLFGIGIIGTKK